MSTDQTIEDIRLTMHRKEWSPYTLEEICDILQGVGYTLGEPGPERTYWAQYAAEQVEPQLRIAVWKKSEGLVGVQIYNQALPAGDFDGFTTLYLSIPFEAVWDLDDMLDKAIEIWERIRNA